GGGAGRGGGRGRGGSRGGGAGGQFQSDEACKQGDEDVLHTSVDAGGKPMVPLLAPTMGSMFEAVRQALIETLRREGVRDRRVLEAFGRVPRERFVPQRFADRAYDNEPLPIGEKQTISQPLVVAVMLEALRLLGGER